MNKNRRTYRADNAQTLRSAFTAAYDAAKGFIEGGPLVIELSRLGKTRDQEARYHALISDISETVTVNGEKYTTQAWKTLLVDQFEQELLSQDYRLRHGSKVYISLDGQRALTERPSTTKFLKWEACQFIEFLYAFGSEHGAKFTEKSLAIYDEYCRG